MENNKKDKAYYIRTTIRIIGLLLLVASIFMLINVATFNEGKEKIQEPATVTHRVLFLCAYNPLYFTYEAQIEGLKEGLYPNGIDFDVIYMDSKNYGTDHDKQVFHDYLKDRLQKDRGYEAVLLAEDDAVEFALKYQDELFKGYPMVFFGVNDIEFAVEAANNPMITGFYENDYIEDCLENAMKAMPGRKKYVALHDDSAAGRADVEIFYSLESRYPDYTFEDIDTSEMTQEELIEKLQNLPEDSVLLYMTCYSDRDGNTYSMVDRTAVVVKYANAPIIRNYSGGRDQGVLGGTYMDFTIQCRAAALVVVDILEKGEDISSFYLDMNTPSKTVYNYPLMQKYGISEKMLPVNTEFVNKPVTFFDYYKRILPVMGAIISSLILLIVSGQLSLREQRRVNTQLLISRDDLNKSQKKLRHQADHDELTDLHNRRAIVEVLNKQIKREDKFAVLMVDIDAFKFINENYGHSVADFILKHLSDKMLKKSTEHGWILGRYGGDEFIIMVPNKNLDVDSEEVTDILSMFRTPIVVGDDTIILSASVGIANSDGTGFPEQHVINAEIAMYEAKEHGKNTAFLYADEMQIKIREENRMKARLAQAFEEESFFMLYQPKVQTSTGKVNGFEALVRVRGFSQGPDVFIPLIEKHGWIIRLGRLITEMVVKQLAEWKEEGHELLPISINFSSKQVNDVGYVEFLKELLDRYNIPAKYVEIEITESLLIEQNIQTQNLFDEFKSMGLRLLMDDFGTGYSSLGYLIYVPVDEIKLDKSLVDAYLLPGKENFIGDVIHLVHDMNKDIIIEGVEEKWQYEKLCEFKADSVQGYYFSEPLCADDAIRFKTGL